MKKDIEHMIECAECGLVFDGKGGESPISCGWELCEGIYETDNDQYWLCPKCNSL